MSTAFAPRNELPTSSTPSPSSRLVLPCALSPARMFSCGDGGSDSLRYLRKSDSSTLSLSNDFRSHERLNPHGHDNTQGSVLFEAFEHSGTQTVLHLDQNLLAALRAERIEHVARVESDRDLFTCELGLHLLLGLSVVRAVRGELELARREQEADRLGALLGQDRHAPQRGRQRDPREGHSMGVGGGDRARG